MLFFKHAFNFYRQTAALLIVLVVLTGSIIYVLLSTGSEKTPPEQAKEKDSVSQIAETNCEISPSESAIDNLEQQMANLINQYRKENSLPELPLSPVLNKTASWTAKDSAARGYIDPNHLDSSRRTPEQRLSDCGYPDFGTDILAQNPIQDPGNTLNLWKNSPLHNMVILNKVNDAEGGAPHIKNWAAMGIGRVTAINYTYWIVDFGMVNDGGGGGNDGGGGGGGSTCQAGQICQGVNLPGADIYHYPSESDPSKSPNPEECQFACNADPNCKAWTWVKPGIQGPDAVCWEKGSVPTAEASDCCSSGAKTSFNLPGGGTQNKNINVSFQCSSGKVNATATWTSDPNQVSFWADSPPGAPVEKTIDLNSTTSNMTISGLSPSSPVNFAVIGPGFEALRSKNGSTTPSCGTGGISPSLSPTKTPTPTPTPTSVPTLTTAPTARPTTTSTPTPTAVPGATNTPTPPTPGQPTVTPTTAPNEARIAMDAILAGIGPNTSLGQNPNPLRRALPVQIQVLNASNQKVKETTGTLNFENTSFKGIVSLGDLATGAYVIKYRLSNTLWKAIPIIQLTSGQTNNAPQQKLITGDFDQNNELNLVDYNILISCHVNSSCDKKEDVDLNLDGKLNELDLNILLSHFAKRQGD